MIIRNTEQIIRDSLCEIEFRKSIGLTSGTARLFKKNHRKPFFIPIGLVRDRGGEYHALVHIDADGPKTYVCMSYDSEEDAMMALMRGRG